MLVPQLRLRRMTGPRAAGTLVVAGLLSASLSALISTALPSPISLFAAPPAPHSGSVTGNAVSMLPSLYASSEDVSPVVMHGRGRSYIAPELYDDGWRHGLRNMWLEDQMGGNWMNVSTLRTYTYPSGRLKPRVLTKLRAADHKRAVRYIKRLQHFGLMPFHRIESRLESDIAARRPPRAVQGMSVGEKSGGSLKDAVNQVS
mmetsp:Transcript_74845/g.173459  ORF Transcript_74845/g.173459 Transcript_74845/m.173459 type:complete len:202 (-) Transcript_74845:67-672(-)